MGVGRVGSESEEKTTVRGKAWEDPPAQAGRLPSVGRRTDCQKAASESEICVKREDDNSLHQARAGQQKPRDSPPPALSQPPSGFLWDRGMLFLVTAMSPLSCYLITSRLEKRGKKP